jgi:endogenous inhibitor of DNA gyrase (YacG/DUF329 family)
MEGQSTADWPEFPFCSPRCRLIDLGRWIGEAYRLPAETEGESSGEGFDAEKEIP